MTADRIGRPGLWSNAMTRAAAAGAPVLSVPVSN